MMLLPSIIGGYRRVAGGVDPDWSNVASLLHFDGIDGSTTFTDQTEKEWNLHGEVEISTAASRFGGASALFVGGGLSTPDSADFDFGAGDFTIEGWLCPTAFSQFRVIYVKRASGANFAPVCLQYDSSDSTRISVRMSTNGSSWTVLFSSTIALVTGTFQSFAVVRHGATVALYINGLAAGSSNALGSSALMTNTSPVAIGMDGDASSTYLGYMDDIRITKGVARYLAPYTPPTTPFPNQGP